MDTQRDFESVSSSSPDLATGENSRRSFLKRSALGSVPALLALNTFAQAGHKSKAPKMTGYTGVPSDQAQAEAAKMSSLPSLFPGWNDRNFQEIRNDENTHVAELLYVLGSSARPKPTFQFLEASTPGQFVALALAFENTGVGAYLQAGYFINNRTYGFVANQIALVEAYHSGYLNTLANSPIVPNANHYANGLSVVQIVTAVTPFIVSLNGGPTPGYQDVQSDANDVNILNFALLLEFLEQEFYNTNVPKFFG